MTVPAFGYRRCVDLSRPLVPGGEQHPWFRYETRTESIVDVVDDLPASGRWYVVTQIAMSGHAGTHVEAPLHAVETGNDVGQVEVECFFGEAAILDLSDTPWSAPFDRKRLEAAAQLQSSESLGNTYFAALGGHPEQSVSRRRSEGK